MIAKAVLPCVMKSDALAAVGATAQFRPTAFSFVRIMTEFPTR